MRTLRNIFVSMRPCQRHGRRRMKSCFIFFLFIYILSFGFHIVRSDDKKMPDYDWTGGGASLGLGGEFKGGDLYTNEWAAHIPGGEEVARDVAKKHGFVFITKIFNDYYLFRHQRISKRSLNSSRGIDDVETFIHAPQVLWAEQQVAKKRVKRDHWMDPAAAAAAAAAVEREAWRERDRGRDRDKDRDRWRHAGGNKRGGDFFRSEEFKRALKRDVHRALSDPKWPRMWYLNRGRGLDMNVMPAWLKGYTGRGIVVSILDDGIEKDHPDIRRNYDADASYDVNDHDYDPQPRYEYSNENRHGTRCAGEVAAEANNGICSAGVAYEANIGGVRMLDGDVTDAVEAQSLSLNPQHIDIYSASWGPDDDGQTVDGPGPLARKAFLDGIIFGRKGRGSIFVWASGNGGRDGDSCNCDGYTNSIYTLSMSSATENGQVPWYSEACSSTLATTYSSGSGSERQIVTTDLHKGCTETHTGTSASAPLAAGICALVLQANPRLTWRDLQHLVVLTSRQGNLEADDWITNGVGRKVSHHFGYGLLDVAALVDLARNWTNVHDQHRCDIVSRQAARGIPVNGAVEVALESDGCRDVGPYHRVVLYVEHVQAVVTLSASRRGEVELFLTSPAGTKSTLLAKRARDASPDGFNAWAFMSTHMWGESALGVWKLEVKNGASISILKNWTLVLYGTTSTSSNYRPRSVDHLHSYPSFHHPRSSGSHYGNVAEVAEQFPWPDKLSGGSSPLRGSKPGTVCVHIICLVIILCISLVTTSPAAVSLLECHTMRKKKKDANVAMETTRIRVATENGIESGVSMETELSIKTEISMETGVAMVTGVDKETGFVAMETEISMDTMVALEIPVAMGNTVDSMDIRVDLNIGAASPSIYENFMDITYCALGKICADHNAAELLADSVDSAVNSTPCAIHQQGALIDIGQERRSGWRDLGHESKSGLLLGQENGSSLDSVDFDQDSESISGLIELGRENESRSSLLDLGQESESRSSLLDLDQESESSSSLLDLGQEIESRSSLCMKKIVFDPSLTKDAVICNNSSQYVKIFCSESESLEKLSADVIISQELVALNFYDMVEVNFYDLVALGFYDMVVASYNDLFLARYIQLYYAAMGLCGCFTYENGLTVLDEFLRCNYVKSQISSAETISQNVNKRKFVRAELDSDTNQNKYIFVHTRLDLEIFLGLCRSALNFPALESSGFNGTEAVIPVLTLSEIILMKETDKQAVLSKNVTRCYKDASFYALPS